MRSKFSQGMSHGRTAAQWGRLGQTGGQCWRGTIWALHSLSPAPSEKLCVSRECVRMGCRNQQHPPCARGLHPPGSGTAQAMCVSRARHSSGTKVTGLEPSSRCCPSGSGSALGLFWDPAVAFEFQPCCLQERGCLCGCSCAGGRRDPSPPFRLCHAARDSPDEVFHQLQVHSLCSCHVPRKRDPTSSWYEMLGLAWPGEITQ